MRQPPRPNVRCRRPEPGLDVPVPGTVVWSADCRAVLYVGDGEGLVDVEALAPRLRQARSVELVGDVWQAARPVKHALREAWTSATRAARAASRPPAPPKPERQLCGRPRRDGAPCRRPAGAGADPGESACVDHGGSTALKDAEARRVVEQVETFARLTVKARTTPLTVRERVQALEALRGVLLARHTGCRPHRNLMDPSP